MGMRGMPQRSRTRPVLRHRPRAVKNSMTTNAAAERNTSATTERTDTDHTDDVDEDLALMTGIFGVDAEGYDHRYSRVRDEVYRTRDGELERVVDLEGRSVEQYIEFVAAEVGWADEWFFESGNVGIAGARRLADARDRTRTEVDGR